MKLEDDVPQIAGDGATIQDLKKLAELADTWRDSLRHDALTISGAVSIQEVSRKEMTIIWTVRQLGADLDQLDMVLEPPDVRREWEKVESAAERWEVFPRSPSSSGRDVLGVGEEIAGGVHALAKRLVAALPQHLR